jgi:hypothetical protein
MVTRIDGATVGDYVTLVRGTTYEGRLVGEPGPALLGLGSIEPGGGFRIGHYKTYGGECPDELMLIPSCSPIGVERSPYTRHCQACL